MSPVGTCSIYRWTQSGQTISTCHKCIKVQRTSLGHKSRSTLHFRVAVIAFGQKTIWMQPDSLFPPSTVFVCLLFRPCPNWQSN